VQMANNPNPNPTLEIRYHTSCANLGLKRDTMASNDMLIKVTSMNEVQALHYEYVR